MFKNCENMLPHSFPVGKLASEEVVHGAVKQMTNMGYIAAIDYEDFNSQHSFKSMQEVMLAFYDTYFDKDEESEKLFD